VLELVVQHGGAEHGAIMRGAAARRVKVVVKGISRPPGVAEMERGRSLVCGGRWREEEEEGKEEEGKEDAAERGQCHVPPSDNRFYETGLTKIVS